MNKITLRDYQIIAINELVHYFQNKPTGIPCLVLPTGAGKSCIIATIASISKENTLVITHQQELVKQDAQAILNTGEVSNVAVYSASANRKEIAPITVASIQSIYKKVDVFTRMDFKNIIVDEAHCIPPIQNGAPSMYGDFLREMREYNPRIKIIGLTATPYRLKQGLLTDKDGLFTDLIEPITIKELQEQGFLALVKSKGAKVKFDLSNVGTQMGEFNQSDLDNAINTFKTNEAVVEEIIDRCENRNHWIIFCTSIEHCREISKILNDKGIKATYVDSKLSQEERELAVGGFKRGIYRAICNVDILTTGFDYPEIDLIAMLRPTQSAGLYLQMVGRGLRLKKENEFKDCLVLDFAENIIRHGSIHNVVPPTHRNRGGEGVAPCKCCPECLEIVPIQVRECKCGYIFPTKKKIFTYDENIDINGNNEPKNFEFNSISWKVWKSKKDGTPMIVVEYTNRENILESVRTFFCICHSGYAREKAEQGLAPYLENAGLNPQDVFILIGAFADDSRLESFLWYLCDILKTAPRPIGIKVKKDMKTGYNEVADVVFGIPAEPINIEMNLGEFKKVSRVEEEQNDTTEDVSSDDDEFQEVPW